MAAKKIAPGQTKIGWIGLGVMGSSMCGHLIDAGFSATVFTRTKAKAKQILDLTVTLEDLAAAKIAGLLVPNLGRPWMGRWTKKLEKASRHEKEESQPSHGAARQIGEPSGGH